jgi:thioredoxin-dependent peroxiredoxin
VTYVIGKDGKIIATLSSKEDKLSPDQHVEKSLALVTAK